MKDNNKTRQMPIGKFVLICFLIVYVVNGLTLFYEFFYQDKIAMTALSLMAILVGNIFLTLLLGGPIFLGYLAIHYADKKAHKENLSKIDFARDKAYFRDILKQYTPASLCYIDNFKVDKRVVAATILNLKLKKKIDIVDQKVIKISDQTDDLKLSEKYIVECIHDDKVVVGNVDYMKRYAIRELLESELIEKNKKVPKQLSKIIIGIIGLVLLFFLCLLLLIYLGKSDFLFTFFATAVATLFHLIFIGLPIFAVVYCFKISSSYQRTSAGEELNKKIEGLKNYIKDFSSLEEREQKDLVLWDEYLVYSVLFHLNNKVMEEMEPLIEIMMAYNTIYFESR